MTASSALLVVAVFLACAVEMVEAATIVVAVGVTRGWRGAMFGVGAGLLALGAVVAILGPALTVIPLSSLRLFVGGLLLVFGLGWLRKAILRAGGSRRSTTRRRASMRSASARARLPSPPAGSTPTGSR